MQTTKCPVLVNANTRVSVLDDGYVQLVDVMPGVAPPGRTIETAIIEAARVSTGLGLKDVDTDTRLLQYLFRNRHTSPFEQVEFKFVIKCPLYVKNQIIRHRTFSFNEFSQRYAEVKDDDGSSFYHPSRFPLGIRGQNTINKQSSVMVSDDDEKLLAKVKIAEKCVEATVEVYKELLQMGMSRETARFCLPNSTWTTLVMKGNLHNFLNFLSLRMDLHAQMETRMYANAIYNLMKPLVPVTIECFENTRVQFITLSAKEIEAIRTKGMIAGTNTEQMEFVDKLKRLGL